MNGGNNILPTMSAYGREMDHHHYNGVSSSGNSNMLTGYPILYQNNHHNHPAGDLLTLQMQLQGNPSNNENENTLAALQRNWIALQQNNGNVGAGAGPNNGLLHSSIHHPPAMTIPNDDMGYMRNLIPIGGSNSSPLHSNQSTLLDSLKFGGGLDPPQVSQYGHHHHMPNGNLQPSILDNGILGSNVGIPGMGRSNPMNVGTSPGGRLQMPMNPNNGLGVNVDMVPNNGMLPMSCNTALGGNVMVNTSVNSSMEWQGGIPIRNIPDLMTMLDLSDIPPHVQIPKYYEGIKISLGEAGREILRCYINQRGIRGKFMSSSNLQQLLRVAHQCGLWNAAVRLHLEFIGEIPMTASHAEMRKYKSLQTKRRLSKRISVLSKFGAPVVRRADGEETIEYRDGMKLSLGVDGRKLLLKRIRETRSSRENEINSLFSKYGLKYSQLRNATIHELCRMAYVCGLWEEAVKLHFQHIRKKAHENTSNQQESGSDLDSEMDLNKDRGDDEMISNNFLQQLHTPGIDMLGVNGAGNPGGMAGANSGAIPQNSVMGAMGADPVHVGGAPAPPGAPHHVHQHPSIHPVSHIPAGMGRYGMSGVGGPVPSGGNKPGVETGNPNSSVNASGGLSSASSMMGIVDNGGGIHQSMVLANGTGPAVNSTASHTLASDHLSYDDYRNYMLDGETNSAGMDSTGLSSMRNNGSLTNISSRIIRHDARGGSMGGASSNGMGKVLGSNPNGVNVAGGGGVKGVGGGSPDVDDLSGSNMLSGMDNDSLIGMSTGALGAFVGSNPAVSRNGLSSYDSIGVASTGGTGYEDYSLLSASLRKRGKMGNNTHNMASGLGAVDSSDHNDLSTSNISHPNTSSFVMETISGILGDEPLGSNMNDKVGSSYKGNNLSSVLGNDMGICQSNEVPQLSAVVVLAAAKAAEAAQGYDNKGESSTNQGLEAVDSMLKSHQSVPGSPVLSSVNISQPLEKSNNEGNEASLSLVVEEESKGVVPSYQKDYSNGGGGMDVPLESSMLLNAHHDEDRLLMEGVGSKMISSGISVESSSKYELVGNDMAINHMAGNDTDIISPGGMGGGVVSTSSATVTSSASLEVSDPFCFPPPMALSSGHMEKSEMTSGSNEVSVGNNVIIDHDASVGVVSNGGIMMNTTSVNNVEAAVTMVSRGLTTQSTTDTSIEAPGN